MTKDLKDRTRQLTDRHRCGTGKGGPLRSLRALYKALPQSLVLLQLSVWWVACGRGLRLAGALADGALAASPGVVAAGRTRQRQLLAQVWAVVVLAWATRAQLYRSGAFGLTESKAESKRENP